MSAPRKFVEWMSSHIANDYKFGRRVFHYHPRSDEHSKKLCQLILEDIFIACPVFTDHAMSGLLVGGINTRHRFPNGKAKTLDLAVGTP